MPKKLLVILSCLASLVLIWATMQELRTCAGLGWAEALTSGEVLSVERSGESVQFVKYRYEAQGEVYETTSRVQGYPAKLVPGDHASISFLTTRPEISALEGHTPMRKAQILGVLTLLSLVFSLVVIRKQKPGEVT